MLRWLTEFFFGRKEVKSSSREPGRPGIELSTGKLQESTVKMVRPTPPPPPPKPRVHSKPQVQSIAPTTPASSPADDSGDFLLSAAIGAVTDNALLGGVIGGDFSGGLVGDILSDGDLF